MRGPTHSDTHAERGRKRDRGTQRGRENERESERGEVSGRDGRKEREKRRGRSCVGLKRGLKRLKCGGEPYLASLLRFNGGEYLKYRRAGFRNSV